MTQRNGVLPLLTPKDLVPFWNNQCIFARELLQVLGTIKSGSPRLVTSNDVWVMSMKATSLMWAAQNDIKQFVKLLKTAQLGQNGLKPYSGNPRPI